MAKLKPRYFAVTEEQENKRRKLRDKFPLKLIAVNSNEKLKQDSEDNEIMLVPL